MAIDNTINTITAENKVLDESSTPKNSLYQTLKAQAGYSLTEIAISVAGIGLLAAIAVPAAINYLGPSRAAACGANLRAYATDIENMTQGGRHVMSQQEVIDKVWDGKVPDHFWYLPNNKDANKGHGNDLDGCDEENPGESLKNRECIPMKWVIICNHNHGDEAQYLYVTSGGEAPVVVPSTSTDRPFLDGMNWYTGKKDPGFERWFGRWVTAAEK